MKILLVGGGSGGPVVPLIAVAERIKKINSATKFLLIGTKTGPEKLLAQEAKIDFVHIVSGKWRRYFSLKNLFTPVLLVVGFFQALKFLRHFKPNCIFGAGSFVQVPVIWAGWFLNIPSVIHQQDVVPSLANKLCELIVKKITVCFEKSLTDFSANFGLFYKKPNSEKVVLTGNPFREALADGNKKIALKTLNLNNDLPVLLVLGGGTGSKFINDLIYTAPADLFKTIQIIHITGSNRNPQPFSAKNYQSFPFLADMTNAYAVADIVLSRAGLSTLTELSNLSKLSIIIPLPNSHQEYNAFLLKSLRCALVFNQTEVTGVGLTRLIKKLLFDLPVQETLRTNISKIMQKNSAEKIAKIIIKFTNEKN